MPNLTGYTNNVLGANGSYPLKMLDSSLARRTLARIRITRNAGYDGSITVQSRPRGSSAAFLAQEYTNEVTGAQNAVAALAAGSDHTITVDVTALEIALLVAGQTVGTATVDTALADQA